MKLPQLGQAVFVIVGDRRARAHVQNLHGEDSVSVDTPTDEGFDLHLGELASLEWTSERGVVRGEGLIASLTDGALPHVVLRLESSRVVQRREHVRIEIVVDAELRQSSGVPCEIKTIDLSGGGMRAYVPRELVEGEPVDVTLMFPEMPSIGAEAEVIRGDVANGYAFRFTYVEPKEHDRLVAFVFEAHRKSFATVKRTG
jgi:c-di-GMP-binding flagellar brake protein YcgR